MNEAALEETTLVRHRSRPDWGLGLLAYRRPRRRAYQFEDGRLREFKEGYYSLLEPAMELSPAELGERRKALVRALSLAGIKVGRPGVAKRRAPKNAYTLEAQVEVFRTVFPDGFADEAWARDHRGEGVPRALKRHRQPAIARAQEQLDREALDALQAAEVVGRFRSVLGSVDLVGKKQLDLLNALGGDDLERLASAWREVLHGEGPYEPRLSELLAALRAGGESASWSLATAAQALVHPERHVAVRLSTSRAQAKTLAPGLSGASTPTAVLYQRHLALGEAVRARLVKAGLAPRDLLDVHDFMRFTLAPKQRKLWTPPAGEEEPAGDATQAA